MLNFDSIKKTAPSWKELSVSSLVILTCLILFLKLPAANFFQETCKEIFFLVLVPIFYIKLVLNKRLGEFGFNLPQRKSDFFWAGGVLFTYLVIFFCLIRFADFKTNYHVARSIQGSFGSFLFYELITFNFLFLFQEVFFKGFVLFSFSSKLKNWSFLIPAFLYCIALFIEKSFAWQMTPLILFSFFGSWLAYKNNSIWLAYATSLISILLLESFLIFISK